jgi:chemotaxis protein methyltransferase CheR
MCGLEAGVELQILGSDLVQRSLDRAAAGAYSTFEIQRGLSAQRMLRWFEQRGDEWVARPPLREHVRFERANLLDEPADDARFDVIFCRHVLCDMEPSRRSRVINGLERRLVDDGCLFLGADERLEGDSVAFRPVNGRRGLYVKSPAALRRAA